MSEHHILIMGPKGPLPTLEEWIAQRPLVRVALSEGGMIASIIIELDGRVLLTDLAWLHRMMPWIHIRVLPIEEGWAFKPEALFHHRLAVARIAYQKEE